MLINNRIIQKSVSTLTDRSIALSNLLAGLSANVVYLTASDYLYIGSDLPFNHRYFHVGTVNAVAASATACIWDGSAWSDAVDVIDQTAVSGAPLAQNGILSWTIDRNKSWGLEETTENMTDSGLESLKIYNMYWARIKFSANLTSGLTLKYVGHRFSTDNDLRGHYPDLVRSNVLDAFKSGKTDWNEQHVLAAEEIARDLRKKMVLVNANQILDWESFSTASVHKVAEIAYKAFGKDFETRAETARDDYEAALDLVFFPVDTNKDGRLDAVEKSSGHSFLRRR